MLAQDVTLFLYREKESSSEKDSLDPNQRYTIESILQTQQRKRKINHLVKWQGWDDPTWEPAEELERDGVDVEMHIVSFCLYYIKIHFYTL